MYLPTVSTTLGSIPACAGEPICLWHLCHTIQVYPRVCGGTSVEATPESRRSGLSPRVRGNHASVTALTSLQRSIPRVCGGTTLRDATVQEGSGLSPRVRGNPRCYRRLSGPGWSIPACAGEPFGAGCVQSVQRVYPRVCGGTAVKSAIDMERQGLSPRVRGNQAPDAGQNIRSRSIPACAGEPLLVKRPPRWMPVYPRVCGGTPSAAVLTAANAGLSPRVRGNRLQAATARHRVWSIPACAGEPGNS